MKINDNSLTGYVVENFIHQAAMKIMTNIGVQIHNEEALEIYKANGVRTEGNTIFLTEEQIRYYLDKAPEKFTIYARNPKYNVEVGGWKTNAAPAYGCAFIQDRDGTVRRGNLEDYVKYAKLVHGLDEYDINGGITVSPADVPELQANVAMFYATLMNSDKAILIGTGSPESMEAMMQAGCELFGGKEEMAKKPRMYTLINTNSPLELADNMLKCAMIMARYGQPLVFCPASMVGATSPLSLTGTLASNACEVLAGICLVQMINPGTPVVYGVQSTALDMKTVGFACAAPEGAKMQGFGANMARFYGVPSRGGGSQSDSPIINVQAGYESMLTFYSAYNHGVNIVMEAGGVLASVNYASFDKLIIDAEIIRQVMVAHEPFSLDEDDLFMEDIEECGHSADFLDCDNTLENFRDLYAPRIGTRGKEMNEEMFNQTIDERIERVLKIAEATKPQMEDAVKDAVKNVLASVSGIDKAVLDRIEAL